MPRVIGDGERTSKDWHLIFSGLPESDSSAFRELCLFCEVHRGQVLATLPWAAAEIGGNDGFALMLDLVRARGGTRLYVSTLHSRFIERLALPIGVETHRRLLAQANAASLIEIPSAWGVFTALRRVAILAALEDGWRPQEVARRFGVSERSLRRTRSEPASMRTMSA